MIFASTILFGFVGRSRATKQIERSKSPPTIRAVHARTPEKATERSKSPPTIQAVHARTPEKATIPDTAEPLNLKLAEDGPAGITSLPLGLPNSIRHLNALNQLRTEAADRAIRNLAARFHRTYREVLPSAEHPSLPVAAPLEAPPGISADRPASAAEIKHAKAHKDEQLLKVRHALTKMSGQQRNANKIAREEFKRAVAQILSEKPWNKIETGFEFEERHYDCRMVPAAQMNNGDHNIFAVSYDGKGVSGDSKEEVRHATNLWTSEIRCSVSWSEDRLLFRGIRHGTLSPYGLAKGSIQREEGTMHRAREVVTAALYARPDLLEKAMNGETVPLQLVSTSLLTPGFSMQEASMLEDQMKAWQQLSSEHPVKLIVTDEHGMQRPVKINLEIAAFNFGVNELALRLKLGQSTSDRYNRVALETMLGKNLSEKNWLAEGWVSKFLSRLDVDADKKRRVYDLATQLKDIWLKKSHHSDGGEAYKAAQRVALLAYEIGAVPAWNCKSGKDRTAILDTELKREAVRFHLGRRPSKPGMIPKDEKPLMQALAPNSGNLEVQVYNTGVPGNVSLRPIPLLKLSIARRIGNSRVWQQLRGLAKLVSS